MTSSDANWMAAQSCRKQPFILCPKYALLGCDVEVKQTTKGMKEIAPILLQPFCDTTCLKIWCIIMLYVHMWINCDRGGMNVCQEHITYSIGSGSPLEKIRVSEQGLHNSWTSYCSAFFHTLQGTLTLCKITGMKQIT